MGASCSIGSAKAAQANIQSEPMKGTKSGSNEDPMAAAEGRSFSNIAYENWLCSSTLTAESKRYKSLSMPSGLDALFEDVLFNAPQQRPYVEPETEAELRKRLRRENLDQARGIEPNIIRETLSEKEACGGRYLRIFVWSNVQATLVHQALHRIVIPQMSDLCKRVGTCIVWVDFRWASSSPLTADSELQYLSRKRFSEMQEMLEAEMERCFCISPLLNFLSITSEDDETKSTNVLPLRVPRFIITKWINASRTLAAAFIERAYPKYATTSDPMEIIALNVEVEEGDPSAAEELWTILESICSGGSSDAEEGAITITNAMIASLTSDPTEHILRRRMKLEIGSDTGLFPLQKCKSMLSYCYYSCFDKIFSVRSAIKQNRPEAFHLLKSAQQRNQIRAMEPMSRVSRLMELLFDMQNNIQYLHLRNNFVQRNSLEEHVAHFCSSASEQIIGRLKLAITERSKFLPGVLEGQLHYRLVRDTVLNRCWDTAAVSILQLCWSPDPARAWRHPSLIITDCLMSERKLLETVAEKIPETALFKNATKNFSQKAYDSEFNGAAMRALTDDYEETNFWRLLEEKKRLQGTLTTKQKRERNKAMSVSAKDLFVQEASHIEVNAQMSEFNDEIAHTLASFADDFALIADIMSIKRHGCILMYDQGDSNAVSSIMNALGVLKAKIMSLPSWKKNQKLNIIIRGAMVEDAICNFSDLVTSICEELAGQNITDCNQLQNFIQVDFTNHSEALKLSAFLQAIPEEQPTVIFCYGIQNLFQTDQISAEICPEKLPQWVMLILHMVCPPSRLAETNVRSSFRANCEIFGGLSQSPRTSYVAMVEQLFIARVKPLETQALSLCASWYCGKQGVITTRSHIFMFAKCMEWNVFADDPGLLKFSAEAKEHPNRTIVKHYILGLAHQFKFSKASTLAVLSLMASSNSEVPFSTILAFIKFVKKQKKQTLVEGFGLEASTCTVDVIKLLSEIQQGMPIEENAVRSTEWMVLLLHLKPVLNPTVHLRGSLECFSLHHGMIKDDVQFATETALSSKFSKMVLLAMRHQEPWKIHDANCERQVTNVMKIRDLLPLVMDLSLHFYALDLLLDLDFVSHYFEAGSTTQLEILYLQASKFPSSPYLLRNSILLRDIQRFLAYNRSLFLSGQKYDLLSLLFNFNGGSEYFAAINKFREVKRARGENVNHVWIKNKSEYGKRNTLRWTSDVRGQVNAWHLLNELNFRFCAISIDMPEPRMLIMDVNLGQVLWRSNQFTGNESHICIKSSNKCDFIVSCSKIKAFLWKKVGTYADSGYFHVHSFQLLKFHICGFDISPNDSNFCTYSDSEGLTVTSWAILTDISLNSKLDHQHLGVTSIYHVGLSSILKFACFLSWDNVLLTSESSGEISMWLIHESAFGLSANPGSSLTEIIRWSIPRQNLSERKASSAQWLERRNLLVLSDVDFVLIYEIFISFDHPSRPAASVLPLKSLQNGFAPICWCSDSIQSIHVIDPSLPALGMNLTHENQSLERTLLAMIVTDKNVSVWSTDPVDNSPEQILVEFQGNDFLVGRIVAKAGGSLILNCKDGSIMERNLEVARYGMIDNTPANGCIVDIRFTANDAMIICSCKSGEVYLYTGSSGFLIGSQMMNQSSISVCCSFSESTNVIYSGDRNGDICCYNFKASSRLPSLKNHQSMVTALATSPSELFLASGDSDGNLTIWNTRNAQVLMSVPNAHSDIITHLKFSPDGSVIWSSSGDGRVASWFCKDGKALHTSKVSDASAMSFDLSADM
jgi:WD40 repeat protein